MILHGSKIYRDRKSLHDFTPEELSRKFRLNRQMFCEVRNIVAPAMDTGTSMGSAIPLDTQILASLRLLATGSFQEVMGDIVGVSQSSVSRILDLFLDCLVASAPQYIKFPVESQDWINRTEAEFRRRSGLPDVIGLVDGTHVVIKKPKVDGDVFLNRNSKPTINVQVVVGAQDEFLDVVANWPGSTHDAHIWRLSGICDKMKAVWHRYRKVLFADSAYGLAPYLITPIKSPSTPPEFKFNVVQSKTRVPVEQVLGQLKQAFRCLDESGGKLLYAPQKAAKMFVACCVLHNLRKKHRLPNFFSPDVHTIVNNWAPPLINARQQGLLVRQRYINMM